MKAFQGASALLVLSVASASAEHIACSSVGSDLASFIALGSHGCVDQDQTYSNFTYDSLESGVAAGDVQVTVDTVLLPGVNQHNMNFQSAGWTSRFLIGFDIAVLSAYPDVSIGTVAFDITAPLTTNNSVAYQTNTPDMGAAFTLQAARNNGGQASSLNVRALRVDIDGRPGSGFTINQAANSFFQDLSAQVPEPATLITMGVGFLALGLYRRRRA